MTRCKPLANEDLQTVLQQVRDDVRNTEWRGWPAIVLNPWQHGVVVPSVEWAIGGVLGKLIDENENAGKIDTENPSGAWVQSATAQTLQIVSHATKTVYGILPYRMPSPEELAHQGIVKTHRSVKYGSLPHLILTPLETTNNTDTMVSELSSPLLASAETALSPWNRTQNVPHNPALVAYANHHALTMTPEVIASSKMLNPLQFAVAVGQELPVLFWVALGFWWNISWDLLTTLDIAKAKTWIALGWNVLKLVIVTGVGGDFRDQFLWWPWRGGANAVLLAQVQAAMQTPEQRRESVAMKNDDIDSNQRQPLTEQALGYLKFATAAYGIAMVRASEATGRHESSKEDGMRLLFHNHDNEKNDITDIKKSQREVRRLAFYMGIPEDDVLVVSGWGGSPTLVGHLLAWDARSESLILAVRGTYSLSDGLVDLNAAAVSAFGGMAHQGMTDMANALWESLGPRVLQELDDRNAKRLVLTGHSLGAGVASLLQLKLFTEGIVDSDNEWSVECYAYASPPVYSYSNDNIDNNSVIDSRRTAALQSSHSFLYGLDTVPFLSTVSVAEMLGALLPAVHGVIRQYPPWKAWAIAVGLEPPPDTLVAAVAKAKIEFDKEQHQRQSPASLGPRLEVAAASVWWILPGTNNKHIDNQPKSTSMRCSPRSMAQQLTIYMDEEMIADHLPGAYRVGLEHLHERLVERH